jgi:hypothetical protein
MTYLLRLFCYDSSATTLLLRLFCYDSTATTLLLRLFCYDSTATTLLLRLYCYGTSPEVLQGKTIWLRCKYPFNKVRYFCYDSTATSLEVLQGQTIWLRCRLKMSIQQGSVLHWFVFFLMPAASKSGIWFHGILLALTRGVTIPQVDYVNAQGHQTKSKQNAGLVAAHHTNPDHLSKLYPESFTRRIPESAVQFVVWNISCS